MRHSSLFWPVGRSWVEAERETVRELEQWGQTVGGC